MALDDSSLLLTQKSNTIFCFAHNAFWEIDEDIRDTEELFNLSFFPSALYFVTLLNDYTPVPALPQLLWRQWQRQEPSHPASVPLS